MHVYERQLSNMLDAAGAELVRERNHLVYKFPDGRIFVQPKTGSDARAQRNAISDLRRMLTSKPLVETPRIDCAPSAPTDTHRLTLHNWEHRDPGVVELPAMPRAPVREHISQPRRLIGVKGGDLLPMLAETDSFWQLSACGRTRVMMRLFAAAPKPPKVISLPVHSFVISKAEEALLGSQDLDLNNVIHRFMLAAIRERLGPPLPALLTYVRDEGYMLVEPNAPFTILGERRIELLELSPAYVTQGFSVRRHTSRGTPLVLSWCGPRHACKFTPDEQWFNAKAIRPVMREIAAKAIQRVPRNSSDVGTLRR